MKLGLRGIKFVQFIINMILIHDGLGITPAILSIQLIPVFLEARQGLDILIIPSLTLNLYTTIQIMNIN